MIDNKTIGVVVPAYNEELLIGKTISTMPEYVDRIYIINDCSKDKTKEIILKFMDNNKKIFLIDHVQNQGVGQSLIDGYVRAREEGMDVVAVMAGDAQMNPDDLINLVTPIIEGRTDYTKGNRLLREDVTSRMPRYRYIGNSLLTFLTKFSTGYWHVIDPQCGYTAISKKALSVIPIEKMTKRYAYNADILNMLNLNNFRVSDIEVEPVYGEEKSKIKLRTYIPTILKLLLQLFFRRIIRKHLVREFHPMFFFYFFSIINFILGFFLVERFFHKWSQNGVAPEITLILLSFSLTMAFFSLFFGMWTDMEENKKLVGKEKN
jgi:glycosyltransferase involved in cell wall biosynthesis